MIHESNPTLSRRLLMGAMIVSLAVPSAALGHVPIKGIPFFSEQ